MSSLQIFNLIFLFLEENSYSLIFTELKYIQSIVLSSDNRLNIKMDDMQRRSQINCPLVAGSCVSPIFLLLCYFSPQKLFYEDVVCNFRSFWCDRNLILWRRFPVTTAQTLTPSDVSSISAHIADSLASFLRSVRRCWSKSMCIHIWHERAPTQQH